jgi:rod shape-determining protein MreD
MVVLWMIALSTILVVLDTTWFTSLSLLGARPDLVLVVLTYFANNSGVQRSQITGFIVGFIEDSISVSPPGFYALVRLAHSAVLGMTRGSMSGDAIYTPVAMTLLAFVIKTLTVLIVSAVLRLDQVTAQVFSVATLLEGVMTVAVAPPAYWLLRKGFDRQLRRYR